MSAQDIWSRLFRRDTLEIDPHQIPATLSRVFREFQQSQQSELTQATRLCSHNLLVVCGGQDQTQGLAEDLDELLVQYPGRAVVVVLDPDHPGPLQGRLACYTRKHQLAGQLIGLHSGGDGAPLPSLLAPLWVDGLPMVTFWRGQPPYEANWFTALVENCTRLVVDCGLRPGNSLSEVVEPLRSLRALIRDPYLAPQAFTDVSWAKLSIWREWVAALFDRPDRRRLLPLVETVELEGWSWPGDALPQLSVLYLASWIATTLNWKLLFPLRQVTGGYEARFDGALVRFYARASEEASLLGRPVRVTFRGRVEGEIFRLSVERDSIDSSTLLLGASGACGGGGSHRLRLDRLPNRALMGQELETDRRDRLFEKSLEQLLQLTAEVRK